MSDPPTTEALRAQLRATHVGGADVDACILAAAQTWHRRIQQQRRDSGRLRPDGQLWQWEDLTPHDQAALVALVGPLVDAALAVLGHTPPPPVYIQSGEHRPCSCCDPTPTEEPAP